MTAESGSSAEPPTREGEPPAAARQASTAIVQDSASPRPSGSIAWLAPLWAVSLLVALLGLPAVLQLLLQGAWIAVFVRIHEKFMVWSSVVAVTVLAGYFLLGGLIRVS